MASLLVDRLCAAAPEPAVATNLSAGDELSWLSDAADAAATVLSQPQQLTCQPGAAALLASLLSGKDARLQLLSASAVQECLQQLHSLLRTALHSPGKLLVSTCRGRC